MHSALWRCATSVKKHELSQFAVKCVELKFLPLVVYIRFENYCVAMYWFPELNSYDETLGLCVHFGLL